MYAKTSLSLSYIKEPTPATISELRGEARARTNAGEG